MFNKQYSSWPKYNKKIINSVSKVLKSGNVNYLNGPNGKIFEDDFCRKFNLKYSCAVANGTLALEIALLSLKLKKSDEVIVTPRSYNSSASSVLRVKSKPVFADIDKISFNLTSETIEKMITHNTKAIICVHLYGAPCNMIEIMKLAKKHKIKVIEDCSQAHGAKYKNNYVGSYGDISIWSFCNDKIISTGGEGGMIACKSKSLYNSIWSLKDIGKNISKFNKSKKKFNYPFMHDFIGTNARLTEIQSIIGIEQLKELDKYLSIRNRNAKILNKYLSCFKFLNLPYVESGTTHAFYRYTISINFDYLKKNITTNKLIKKINSKNIVCNVGGCPEIYKEITFKKYFPKKILTNTNFLKNKTISFIVDNTISKKNMKKVSEELKNIFSNIENL